MEGRTVSVLDDPDQVVDSLSGFRRSILAALDEPDSATGVARRLGTTRQRVNYHLRALEGAGLVELHESRRRRGLTERVMRRSSQILLVDPTAFDPGGLTDRDRAGLGGVVALASDLIGQAATVSAGAGRSGQRVAAAALDTEIRLARPGDLEPMLAEIAAVIARHDAGDTGLRIRVGTAVLPCAGR